jgi:type IV pilus assembly protein PilE
MRGYVRGFTLIELMIVVVIVGVLSAIALPSYRSHIVRSARIAAQGDLLELAGLQEKIFLNSNSYAYGAVGLTAAYNGTNTGGLGRTSGQSKDGKYAISIVTLASDTTCPDVAPSTTTTTGAQQFVLIAVPVTGMSQEGDGSLCVSESGRRLWVAATW